MDDEPKVLRSWPYEVPDGRGGWLYYRLGSYQATGALVYEPNPEWTAHRLAQAWRWEQVRMELEAA